MGEQGTCPRCGKESREGASFCTACGMDLRAGMVGGVAGEGLNAASENRADGAEEIGGSPPVSLPRPPEAEAASATPLAIPGIARRRRLALVAGMMGGVFLAAGAVMLVLYFISWRKGGGVEGPVDLARKYMRALEEKDVHSYLDCFAEGGTSSEGGLFPEGLDIDHREWVEMGLRFMEVEFRDVRLDLERQEGDEATVVTKSGTLAMSVLGMETEVDLGEEPMRFRMVRKGGKWYLVEDPLPGLFAPEFLPGEDGLELDLEDLDLPDIWKELPDNTDFEEMQRWFREMQEWLEEGESPEEVPEDSSQVSTV